MPHFSFVRACVSTFVVGNIALVNVNNLFQKVLLDLVLVIAGLMKVLVSVVNLSLQLWF